MAAGRARAKLVPSRAVELEFLSELVADNSGDGPIYLAGVDEVGRGALAGPVSVGIALISLHTSDDFPAGLRDSKMLSARAREALVEPCMEWAEAIAVGHASVEQINQYGIVAGLRFAAANAVTQIEAQGKRIAGVLLDGSHNWWAAPGQLWDADLPAVPVHTLVKGDAQCAVVAAASVVAKVRRDAMMVELAEQFPDYDWVHNKGYSSAKHVQALAEHGASLWHRTSWKLPGLVQSAPSAQEAI